MSRLYWLLLWLPVFCAVAQEDGYVDTGQWQVSLALGYGQKSNPLVGGDDLPLVLLPEIAYYGERFYFDNGDLGYTFIDSEGYSLSAVTRLNVERAYFSFLHPSNILISNSVAQAIDSGEVCIDCDAGDNDAFEIKLPSIDDLSKRDYALDGGLQLNLYLSDWSMLRAEIMQDVSGAYKGQNAMIELTGRHMIGQLQLGATIGLRYKSKKLVDYYYGIDQMDDVDPVFHYEAKAAIEPYFKLTGIYPVTERWSLIALGRYNKLASAMTDSPVVEDNNTTTLYLGAGYAF